MPMFMCRWRNGDRSFVFASDEDDAIIHLDEWDDAEQAELTRIKHFMIDLALTEEGDLKLQQLGEETDDVVWTHAFPNVGPAREKAPRAKGSIQTFDGAEIVREAVRTEKSRPLLITKRKGVEREIGKEIQERLGAPAAAINRYVQDAASDQLAKMPVSGRKHGPVNSAAGKLNQVLGWLLYRWQERVEGPVKTSYKSEDAGRDSIWSRYCVDGESGNHDAGV
jgi:hypothetical protein